MFTSFNARALGLTVTIEETLRIASENGFEGVDLMIRDVVEQGVDHCELKRSMDDLGLRAGAFPFPFDWRGEGARFDADMALLPRYAELASRIGLTRTATWVLPDFPRPAAADALVAAREQARDLHRLRLGRAAKVLADYGIRLGLEVIG